MEKLPKGYKSLEDVSLVNYLCTDEIFLNSIAESEGALNRVYADWSQGLLVYEFKNGLMKCYDLSQIVSILKEVGYTPESN